MQVLAGLPQARSCLGQGRSGRGECGADAPMERGRGERYATARTARRSA